MDKYAEAFAQCPTNLPVFRVNKVPKRFASILKRDNLVVLLTKEGVFCKYPHTHSDLDEKFDDRFKLPSSSVQFVCFTAISHPTVKALARSTTLSYRP
jgi:hypothetical protein